MGLYGSGLYGANIYSATVRLTVAQDSAFPPRILVTVTDLTVGDVVTVYRSVGGSRTAVRGADTVTVPDTTLVVNDGEYPFGVAIEYVANVNGTDAETADITPTLAGGNVVLSDAITGMSVECLYYARPNLTNTRQGTRYDIGGRSMFVSAPRAGAEADAQFITTSTAAREDMLDLLAGATSGIILVRTPNAATYPGFDGHYIVIADTEALVAQSGTDPRRLWTLDLIETAGWASTLLASGWTLADIQDAYTGGTLADIQTDFAADQLLDIEVRDWGSGRPS